MSFHLICLHARVLGPTAAGEGGRRGRRPRGRGVLQARVGRPQGEVGLQLLEASLQLRSVHRACGVCRRGGMVVVRCWVHRDTRRGAPGGHGGTYASVLP